MTDREKEEVESIIQAFAPPCGWSISKSYNRQHHYAFIATSSDEKPTPTEINLLVQRFADALSRYREGRRS